MTPDLIRRAHQYLYYVLSNPVISDLEYDRFCSLHGLECGGGSDCADHYSQEEIELADRLLESSVRP